MYGRIWERSLRMRKRNKNGLENNDGCAGLMLLVEGFKLSCFPCLPYIPRKACLIMNFFTVKNGVTLMCAS